MAKEIGFRLGLLPEKKRNWKSFAASYGLVLALLLFFILFGLIVPDSLQLKASYHVTELIPLPAMKPEPAPIVKRIPVQKLPPAPVETVRMEAPKLLVPKEIRAPKPQPQQPSELAKSA